MTAQTQFPPELQHAYELTLNLQIEEALEMIPEPTTAHELYVVSLAQALELAITEDQTRYEEYHDQYLSRIEKRSRSKLDDDLFLQAELRLFWVFVYLKFGHELQAAWNLRQSYLSVSDCKAKFPDYFPILKTSAVLEILLGSVPEKYNWILGLMNMQGSVSAGLDELNQVRGKPNLWQREAIILKAVLQGFVFQQTRDGVNQIDSLLSHAPDNRLLNFLGAALAIKDAQNEKALQRLLHLETLTDGIPLHASHYLTGEVYLHKGEYYNAISAYRLFLRQYQGMHNVKDALYKTGLCYWLLGDSSEAEEYFDEARSTGKEETEADKHAARRLADDEMPNRGLTRARYLMDGGYFERARQELAMIQPESLTTTRTQVEYFYRYARLAHQTGNLDDAKKFYRKTIDTGDNHPWYYAPNACLQMGYLMKADGNLAAARDYFTRAREYPRHEYKNSIDSKAKSALAQLN